MTDYTETARAWLGAHPIATRRQMQGGKVVPGSEETAYLGGAAIASLAALLRAEVEKEREANAVIAEKRQSDCIHDGSPDAVSHDDDGKHLNGCSRCWEDAEVAAAIRARRTPGED